MSKPIYILNGPNLNLLGTREPEIYGTSTLSDIETGLLRLSANNALVFRQTNHEGVLIDWVQESAEKGAVLILNPGAFTHTSIALHDALKACAIPIIELHLSNPEAREAFRHVNFVAPIAQGRIAGFGAYGYELALKAAQRLILQEG